jgi:hypothetical protein
MKSNFNKLSFQDLLNYNPYEKEFNFLNDGIEESDFDEIFVLIPEFEDEEAKLIKALDPYGNERRNIITLSGYSGNGKTTFLNWIKPRFEERGYYFKINNIIKEGVGHITSEELISKSMAKELIQQLQESDCTSFKAICGNEKIFFNEFDLNLDTQRYLSGRINVYSQMQQIIESGNTKEFAAINRLIDSLPLKQVLIIYFLEYLIKNSNENRESCIFCFDNLDEIEFEYLTENFWTNFLDIKSLMISFCQSLKLKIDFTRHVFFIFVFREATLQIRNAHFSDRLLQFIGKTRIILTGSARAIVKKRISTAEKYFEKSKLDSSVYHLTKILATDVYTDKVLLPLFNFDYRTLNRTIHQILKDEESRKIVDIYISTKKEFEYGEIENIDSYGEDDVLSGLRGAMLHLFISFLFDNRKFFEFASKNTIPTKTNQDTLDSEITCRPSRMLLTALCSLSYPDGLPRDHTNLMLIRPKEVGLLHLYNTIRRINAVSEVFFEWIGRLFDVHMGSWAHMVSIFNKEIKHGSDLKIDFNDESLKLSFLNLNQFKSNIDNSNIEKELNHIKICINASGYIYLSTIMVHYEYFVNLVMLINPNKKIKPLFQSIDFDYKEAKYEFEVLMNLVYEYVSELKNKLDKSLENVIFKSGYELKSYVNSEFGFKRHNDTPKLLYSTRIITTHIQYLDAFRYFLCKSKSFTEIQDKLKKHEHFSFQARSNEKINEILVAQIEKYVKLLKTGIKEDGTDQKVRAFEEKISQIKAKGYGCSEWIRILLDNYPR